MCPLISFSLWFNFRTDWDQLKWYINSFRLVSDTIGLNFNYSQIDSDFSHELRNWLDSFQLVFISFDWSSGETRIEIQFSHGLWRIIIIIIPGPALVSSQIDQEALEQATGRVVPRVTAEYGYRTK